MFKIQVLKSTHFSIAITFWASIINILFTITLWTNAHTLAMAVIAFATASTTTISASDNSISIAARTKMFFTSTTR